MKILSIETSCDETAISIVNFKSIQKFEIIFDEVLSQIKLHQKYGGVFPAMAQREHLKNIFPLLKLALQKNKIKKLKKPQKISSLMLKKLEKILNRDTKNLKNIIKLLENYQKPKLNALAVTYGPGLEMSLWTGFNFARALSLIWNLPLIPINHMEGHIHIARLKQENNLEKIKYPLISLLISGGHTELVLSKKEFHYKILGQTLDDAVGEAFDKTARLLKLTYPGGPEISKLANKFTPTGPACRSEIKLPRPMLQKNNFDFSFSGLKTAVLYLVKSRKRITQKFKIELSAEFENAVSDVLISKTKKALKKYQPQTLIIGGGVSANNRLRREFKKLTTKKLRILIPQKKYTGDNSLMIALAAYTRFKNKKYPQRITKVYGNLKLE